MARKEKILLDVDDVIIDLVPQWLRVFNMVYNEDLKPEDITDWNIQSFAKKPEHDIYMVLKKWHDYSLCGLIEDSLWGVEQLRTLGYRVIFVTSTPEEHKGIKFKYLNKHGFNVERKDYIETSDKSKVKGKILLDDNFKNILETPAKGVLFNRNWNRKEWWDYRVDTWKEFIFNLKEGIYDKPY